MDTILFTAYGRPCTNYDPRVSQYQIDHLFVVSTAMNNWNCFGGGQEEIYHSHENAKGMGNARWASLIYGPYEGRNNQYPAAGLTERYDGVCHTAANRILVLTGDDVDARGAAGNELATLMYGKVGFDFDKYIGVVKDAALTLNKEHPGTLTEADIETVISRITRDLSPDEELQILNADVEARFQSHFGDFTDPQKQEFARIYTDFQTKRKEAFDAESQSGNTQDFQPRFAKRLQADLRSCLQNLFDLLTPEKFLAVFKVPPDVAMRFLLLGGP